MSNFGRRGVTPTGASTKKKKIKTGAPLDRHTGTGERISIIRRDTGPSNLIEIIKRLASLEK